MFCQAKFSLKNSLIVFYSYAIIKLAIFSRKDLII